MTLTIENADVVRLAAEVSAITGESTTEAIRVALEERRSSLTSGIDHEARVAELRRFVDEEIWSLVPEQERGRPHDSARDDALVGYGPDGLPE